MQKWIFQMPTGNHTFRYAGITAEVVLLVITLGMGCASKEEVTQRLEAEAERIAESQEDSVEVMGPMPDTALFGTDTTAADSAAAQ